MASRHEVVSRRSDALHVALPTTFSARPFRQQMFSYSDMQVPLPAAVSLRYVSVASTSHYKAD